MSILDRVLDRVTEFARPATAPVKCPRCGSSKVLPIKLSWSGLEYSSWRCASCFEIWNIPKN